MNSTILESGERCARQEHEAEVIPRSHILESSLSIFATSRRCIAHDRAFKGTNTNRRAKMDDRLQLSIVPLARNTPDASQDSWPVIGTQALLPMFRTHSGRQVKRCTVTCGLCRDTICCKLYNTMCNSTQRSSTGCTSLFSARPPRRVGKRGPIASAVYEHIKCRPFFAAGCTLLNQARALGQGIQHAFLNILLFAVDPTFKLNGKMPSNLVARISCPSYGPMAHTRQFLPTDGGMAGATRRGRVSRLDSDSSLKRWRFLCSVFRF